MPGISVKNGSVGWFSTCIPLFQLSCIQPSCQNNKKKKKKERKENKNPPFRMRKEGSRHRRSTSSSQTRKYPPTPILFHSILFCNSTFSPLLFCLCRYSFSLPSTLCIRSTPPFLNVRLLTDCVGGASSLVIVVVPQDSRIFIFPSVWERVGGDEIIHRRTTLGIKKTTKESKKKVKCLQKNKNRKAIGGSEGVWCVMTRWADIDVGNWPVSSELKKIQNPLPTTNRERLLLPPPLLPFLYV